MVVFVVIATGGALLFNARGFVVYALGAWIWEVGFTWGCIYQTAAIACLDPHGRAIMLIPAAFGMSSMAGPALAGVLVADGFGSLLGLVLVTGALPLVAFGMVMARRLDGAAPTTEEIAPVAEAL